MTARIDIRSDALARRLEQLADHWQGWEDFWPEAEEAIQRRESIWLRRQGEGSWPPLSPGYAKAKAKARPGRPMLVYDGDLRRVLTTDAFTVARTSRELWMSTSQSGAGYHRSGTSKMPARDPIAPIDRLAAGIGQRARIWARHAQLGMFA